MDRNNPVLSVLSTSHEDTASFKVNVLDACQSEFGYPHSAGIKDTEENRHDHPAVGTFRWNRLAFVYCLEKAPEFIRCINVGIILRGAPCHTWRRDICFYSDIIQIPAEYTHLTDPGAMIGRGLITAFPAPFLTKLT